MKNMRVAVIGSRKYSAPEHVRNFIKSLTLGTVIISGGAPGVDTWAAEEARRLTMRVDVYRPRYDQYLPHVAPLMRNREIVEASDHVVAFWDGESRGTKNAIDYAESIGKPVTVHIHGTTKHG